MSVHGTKDPTESATRHVIFTCYCARPTAAWLPFILRTTTLHGGSTTHLAYKNYRKAFDIKGGCFYEARDIQVVPQLVRAAWSVPVKSSLLSPPQAHLSPDAAQPPTKPSPISTTNLPCAQVDGRTLSEARIPGAVSLSSVIAVSLPAGQMSSAESRAR
jgi:hypothetical protein